MKRKPVFFGGKRMKFEQSEREAFINSLATERLRAWTCPKHNVKINLTSKCPLCEEEKSARERKKIISKINNEELKTNKYCKVKKGYKKNVFDKNNEAYKEYRRKYMKAWRKKVGKEYYRDICAKSRNKDKNRKLEHSL